MPGRSVKSRQKMVEKIRKEVADAYGADSSKTADDAVNTTSKKAAGSTGKLLSFFLFIILTLF